jgi:CheY-like chemotaxis protein
MDAIGQLTGGIAHDFNNLLAAVLGGLSLIERRLPVTDDQRRILTMSRRAAEQGTELVRRLLAFARRQQLLPDRVALDKLATSVRDLLAHTLGGLVALEWVPDDTVSSPFADESQLELALVNLVINARDAMPGGGVVTIRASDREADARPELALAPGSYVVLRVDDHGEGIPAEHLSRVMDPFFTTKEVGKGTGLGLSMVYGFATQSGGAVHIDSEVGRGTTVELWLPRAPELVRVAPPVRVVLPTDAPTPNGTPLRILLVDDHPGVRATTACLLADFGHDVSEAAAGPEALATLVADPQSFDVLITDYAMPGMSGAELIRQSRRLRPDLPAIIVTGYVEVESLAARPDDVQVLVKPFDGEALSSLLEAIAGQPGRSAAR